MPGRVLSFSFYFLFTLTPLLWFKENYELFEFNKMMFVYAMTIIIAGLWLIKSIHQGKFIIKRTPLDIPILLFFASQVISTYFSIDKTLSIWGYYSRSNGGLLSILCYIILYYAFVSNVDRVFNYLKAGIVSGVIVSLWAIFEHFGSSFSCVIISGSFNTSCWVQDVQARVFATLGQPNWLAAYLLLLLFPCFYFLTVAKETWSKLWYLLALVLMYLAFSFTFSRSAALGLLVGSGFYLMAVLYQQLSNKKFNFPIKISTLSVALLIGITLIFGSALSQFKLFSQFSSPTRESITSSLAQGSSIGTQLENGGTESGQIRLIVWQGALEIVKHYPLFGSGVETFAYAYYQYRPIAHNTVSEWDFLYNKAHNEFLNYLATTGIIGLISYISIIVVFLGWWLLTFYKSKISYELSGFPLSLIAGYIGNLVVNFFGFSVVTTALFSFLYLAIIFIYLKKTQELVFPKSIASLFSFVNHRRVYNRGTMIIVGLGFLFLLYTLSNFYKADLLFAQGMKASERGSPGKAYNLLSSAVTLHPYQSIYQSELAYAAASAAVALEPEDATLSAELKDQAVLETDNILKTNPHNVSFYRTAIRTFYMLSNIDESFVSKSLEMIDRTIILAPTDPKLYFHKATILSQSGKHHEAIEPLQKAIELKPNYREAYLVLADRYIDINDYQKAKETLNKLLELIPEDPEALEKSQNLPR